MSARFDSIDCETQRILSSILEAKDAVIADLSREYHQGIATLTIAISQLLRDLKSFNQDEHHRVRQEISQRISRDTFSSSNDVVEITAAIEMLDISNPEERKLRESVTKSIIQSLSYTAMTNRYEDVVEAHPQTFEWAFHDPTKDQLPWSNFSAWLKTGRGVYWVSGKAGSGKSTFMKHIFDSERTRKYLESWAGDTPLCLATFFFWNSGLNEQKSQAGCLRALLFQNFSKYPDLIPLVLPELWTSLYSESVRQGRINDNPSQAWTLKQLMGTFKVIVRQKSIPIKICFLIDGLDEFDGDHDEMAILFKEITNSEDVKVCLSSRPWVVFEDLFSACEGLLLQNLTHRDIQMYVGDRLVGNDAFQRLASRDPVHAENLKLEIVDKAEGVFLWVKLVVQSLLNGIRNRDGISDLWDRLRLLPRELEPLYNRLLDLIEPVYLPWVSKSFQVLRANHTLINFREARSWRGSPVRTPMVSPLSLRGFDLAMNSEKDIETIRKWNLSQLPVVMDCDDMIVRLTARCAGFLEVPLASHCEARASSLVQYFHRTARDFLESKATWSRLLLQTAGTDFDPNVALMISSLMSLRFGNPQELSRDFLVYASHVNTDITKDQTQYVLLDKFDELKSKVCQMPDGSENHWIPKWCPESNESVTIFEMAALHGLCGYVGNKLSQLPVASRKTEVTRLLHRILPPHGIWVNHGRCPLPRLEMVSLLLGFGACPDDGQVPLGAWGNTLKYVTLKYATTVNVSDLVTQLQSNNGTSNNSVEASVSSDSLDPLVQRYISIMKLLVLSGADPYAHIPGVREDALGIVRKFCVPFFPEESAELLDEIHIARAATRKKKARNRQNEDGAQCRQEKPKKRKMWHRLNTKRPNEDDDQCG
jgi:hypothetical protein